MVTGCPADRRKPIQVSLYSQSNIALFHDHFYLLKKISHVHIRCPWLSNSPSAPGTSPPVNQMFSGAGVDTSPSDPAAGDPTSALYLGFHHKIIPRAQGEDNK